MPLTTIDTHTTLRLLDEGALLVDIREEADHARLRVPGALHAPFSALPRRIGTDGSRAIVFLCAAGIDTVVHGGRLMRAAGGTPAFTLTGGIEAWRATGLPVEEDPRILLPLQRQFLLALGAAVLACFLLDNLLGSAFEGIELLLGAGLVVGGLTGRCRLMAMLSRMPWNRGYDPDLPDDLPA